jgi:hypothetical protein
MAECIAVHLICAVRHKVRSQEAFASFMSIITQPCTSVMPASAPILITSSEPAPWHSHNFGQLGK